MSLFLVLYPFFLFTVFLRTFGIRLVYHPRLLCIVLLQECGFALGKTLGWDNAEYYLRR
jgi:hypothetical protein